MKKLCRTTPLLLLLPLLLCNPAFAADDEILNRLDRVEKKLDGKVLIGIVNEMEELRREVRQLRGDLEEQSFSIKQMEKRQQNIFDDLDSRVQALEGGQPDSEESDLTASDTGSSGDIETANDDPDNYNNVVQSHADAQTEDQAESQIKETASEAAENASGIVPIDSFSSGGTSKNQPQDQQAVLSSEDEENSYSEAFNLLKEGHQEASIEKFEAFIQQHPSSNYADNAQYWMGEAYYAQRQFEPAIKEYKKLLENYPESGKASHALLKIGYSYDELDDKAQAEGELEELISRYPGTSAASLAQQRLDHIRSE